MCNQDIAKEKVDKMSQEYISFFGIKEKDHIVQTDFNFLQELRSSFDKAYRNSISPRCSGFKVDGSTKKVMRFNSINGIFVNCNNETCDKCSNKQFCQSNGVKRNNSSLFINGVKEFFDKGIKFYSNVRAETNKFISSGTISSQNSKKWTNTLNHYQEREEKFKKTKSIVLKALEDVKDTSNCFTIPYEKYTEIFAPMKKLYWDEVALKYIDTILAQFYKQCDSVLNSAKLFEKFIKTLSIADFMNNMEGNV